MQRTALRTPRHSNLQEIKDLSPRTNPLDESLLDRKTPASDLELTYERMNSDDKPTSTPCRKVAGNIAYGSYIGLLLLAAAAADTITFTLGLKEQDKKFLGVIEKTDATIYALTAFYFAQYLVITAPYVIEGMTDSIDIVKTRSIPRDWKALPKGKEISAATIGLTFAAYSVIGEATATYGFWKDLGVPPIYAAVLSTFYGKTSLLSESRKAWENIRNIFLFFHNGSTCGPISIKPSNTLGYLLALFSAAGAMILGYDGITEELSVKDLGLRIFLLAFALSKGFTDMSLNGKINVDALEELFGQPQPTTSLAPAASTMFKVAAGLGSIFFGSIVSESFAKIYTNSLETAALPFTIPEIIPPVLGYGIAVSQGTNVTYATYEFFNLIRKALHAVVGRCRHRKKETQEELDLEMTIEPTHLGENIHKELVNDEQKKPPRLAPYSTGNTSVTFAPPRVKVTIPSQTPAPTSGRCVIL